MKDPGIELFTHVIQSPIGELSLAVLKRGGLYAIRFGRRTEWPEAERWESNKYACGELALELGEYFAGKRQGFSLSLQPRGSEFQKSVWHALTKIPYGTTVSYGELARRVGRRGAARAVATAVALNPLPIIVPCHRIILQSGAPGLYAARSVDENRGRAMKKTLLQLEGIELNWNSRH